MAATLTISVAGELGRVCEVGEELIKVWHQSAKQIYLSDRLNLQYLKAFKEFKQVVAQSIRIGAGGSWRVFDEMPSARVVKQQSGVSCGPACGEMLFADRGVKITQEMIEKASFVPIDAIDLATVLNKLEPSQTRLWLGGTLTVSGSDEELIKQLNNTGSWGAVMWERGASIGHLIVVNGLNDKGRLIVRDPWDGTTYTMEVLDFLAVWSRMGLYARFKQTRS